MSLSNCSALVAHLGAVYDLSAVESAGRLGAGGAAAVGVGDEGDGCRVERKTVPYSPPQSTWRSTVF